MMGFHHANCGLWPFRIQVSGGMRQTDRQTDGRTDRHSFHNASPYKGRGHNN